MPDRVPGWPKTGATMPKVKITDELIAKASGNPYSVSRPERRALERHGLLRKRGRYTKTGQFRYAWGVVRPKVGR